VTITNGKAHVAECTAKLKGYGTAHVSMYANSLYGNHTQVVIGVDEPTYSGATQPGRLFDRGRLQDDHGPLFAGTTGPRGLRVVP
jgi:hypothetical protein